MSFIQDSYMSQLPSKHILVRDQSYIHTLIEKGEFAIFGKIIDSIFFPENEIFNEDIKVRYKNAST